MPYEYLNSSLVAVGGVTFAGVAATLGTPNLIPVLSIVLTGLVTGLVTYFSTKSQNKKYIAEADNLREQTQSVIVETVHSLMLLKQQEIDTYKLKIEELDIVINKLKIQITELGGFTRDLQKDNEKLTSLLGKRFIELFQDPEGKKKTVLLTPPTESD